MEPDQPLFARLRAQPTARRILERALESGRVHHAYLFIGPDGVGKELAAFGLAQALLCEARGGDAAHGVVNTQEVIPFRSLVDHLREKRNPERRCGCPCDLALADAGLAFEHDRSTRPIGYVEQLQHA